MIAMLLSSDTASAFDHEYTAYTQLLTEHVYWTANGHASVVDYARLSRNRAALAGILDAFSEVSEPEFVAWTREQQMAFLINAYNGFTLDLILSRYPDLKSIRDLGSLLRSPWKQPFFRLLGDKRTLDWIEHEQLRAHYREPRAHFAVNCASISCPALRPEAYAASRLDAQLEDQQRRFLSDRTRNRFNAAEGTLYVSQIFRWFSEDFVNGDGGVTRWFAAHADLLADDEADRRRIRGGHFEVDHLSYNWLLNGPANGASRPGS